MKDGARARGGVLGQPALMTPCSCLHYSSGQSLEETEGPRRSELAEDGKQMGPRDVVLGSFFRTSVSPGGTSLLQGAGRVFFFFFFFLKLNFDCSGTSVLYASFL